MINYDNNNNKQPTMIILGRITDINENSSDEKPRYFEAEVKRFGYNLSPSSENEKKKKKKKSVSGHVTIPRNCKQFARVFIPSINWIIEIQYFRNGNSNTNGESDTEANTGS